MSQRYSHRIGFVYSCISSKYSFEAHHIHSLWVNIYYSHLWRRRYEQMKFERKFRRQITFCLLTKNEIERLTSERAWAESNSFSFLFPIFRFFDFSIDFRDRERQTVDVRLASMAQQSRGKMFERNYSEHDNETIFIRRTHERREKSKIIRCERKRQARSRNVILSIFGKFNTIFNSAEATVLFDQECMCRAMRTHLAVCVVAALSNAINSAEGVEHSILSVDRK